jgi:hypothetical protein
MESYLSEDYLKLFQNTPKSQPEELKPINEVGRYDNMPKLNEVSNLDQYKINENVNDGWSNQFEIETRVNGQVQRNNSDPYKQQMRRNNVVSNNGLEKYLVGDEDDIRETYNNKIVRQENNNISTNIHMNESFDNAEVVSVELFERVNYQVLAPLAPKFNQICT